MIICGWVQNRILAFQANEIGGVQAGIIRQHIAGCKHCQKAIEILKRAQQAVSIALTASVIAPEGLTSRILAALDDLPPGASEGRSRFRRRQ